MTALEGGSLLLLARSAPLKNRVAGGVGSGGQECPDLQGLALQAPSDSLAEEPVVLKRRHGGKLATCQMERH